MTLNPSPRRPRMHRTTANVSMLALSAALPMLPILAAPQHAAAAPVHHFDISVQHGCAANDDGWLWCWGGEEFIFGGDHGVKFGGPPSWPFQVGAGERHSCVNVRDVNGPTGFNARGFIDCWGRNEDGQIDVPPEHDWRQLAVGQNHNCATDWTNHAICWGRDDFGQVSDAPANVLFSTLSLHTTQSCGVVRRNVGGQIIDGDAVQCWGKTAGDIDLVRASDLPYAANGERFVQVSAGFMHTCARSNFDNVYCWGDDGAHQLSPSFEGTPTGVELPIEDGGTMQYIPGDRSYIDVAAGEAGTCAVYDDINGDRGVQCWGFPYSSDVSLWTTTTKGALRSDELPLEGFEPEQVQLTFGEVCALDTDAGELRCWFPWNAAKYWACDPTADARCCDDLQQDCCSPAAEPSCCDPSIDPFCHDLRSWDLLPDVDVYANG